MRYMGVAARRTNLLCVEQLKLMARTLKALDSARHSHSLYNQLRQRLSISGEELYKSAILFNYICNMDVRHERLVSVPSFLKVLVDKYRYHIRDCKMQNIIHKAQPGAIFSQTSRIYLVFRVMIPPP